MDFKYFLISTFFFIQISGAPQLLISQYNSPYSNGKYEFGFETENGIQRQEMGFLKPVVKGPSVIVIEGSYSFTAPNNKVYIVRYIADENGYRILPTKKQTEEKPKVQIEEKTKEKPEIQTEEPQEEEIQENVGGQKGIEIEESTEQTPAAEFRRKQPADIPYEEGIDNRVAIPPDLIGSLIGGR